MEKKEKNNGEWWAKRAAATQDRLTKKGIKDTEKQLIKYYQETMDSVISSFEATLDKLIVTMENDRDITPADLYNLDKYWQMQGQLKKELQKLGDKQVELLSKRFTEQYIEIYQAMALHGESLFNSIDTATARQMINHVWCADGKTWSNRVWTNMDKLQETLNSGLIDCVVAGNTSSELKKKLIKRFGVAYHRADTIVRTEMAHIQTQAAQQRYKDYGLRYYEILGNDDDSCGNHSVDCHEMDGKRFLLAEMQVGVNAPPFHPNCRCCITPVVED